MMNKIKSLHQLKAERKQLARRREELEKAMRYDWLDIKNSLQPKRFAGSMLSGIKKEESKTDGSFLSALAASVTENAVLLLEKKIANWLKKR